MNKIRATYRNQLLAGAALAAAIACAPPALAQTKHIDIAAQPLAAALYQLGSQTGQQIIFSPELADAKMSKGTSSADTIELALNQLLDGTGLSYKRTADAIMIVRASDPQSGSAAGDGADGTVQALIVTAQKREENIQDVPIAMSAFTQEDLERSQVSGGPDLMTQVPNMTFTKTNFTSYSIQIRGIGTQAISATTDAAVAVAFNNTPFIRNRFFEQEFYDLQRVEVLRGPQGTLYGRNATAGVVNILSAKPTFGYEARLSADVANYKSTRLEGMVNIPLVDDKVALRIAGAWTKRDGFDRNQITGNQIDGRDLWSTRLSLRFEPTDTISANLIWEHFQEDDDRLRSGKQLCHRDDRTELGGISRPVTGGYSAGFNQSCLAASLFAPESFQAPDGYSLPFYLPLGALFLPVFGGFDPYLSTTQSRDLRVIESTVDPEYRAKSDVAEFQFNIDLSNDLTLTSETGYGADTLFSLEDYNRFNTAPGAWSQEAYDYLKVFAGGQAYRPGVLNNGVFCDPQLGCSDRLVAVDLSTAKSRQFSQEFRLGSNYSGPFNFSLGANFLRYDTEDKYYVFINSLSMYSAIGDFIARWPGGGFPEYVPGVTDDLGCLPNGPIYPDVTKAYPVVGCLYIDPNPIGSLNDQGHNYFLSKNPYKLLSYAVFGEAYYDITPDLKLTAGLRWTVDRKEAPRIPSWLLAADTVGYPVAEIIRQEWREPTGRLALDWKPDLSFTDETLLYASYAHGYKAGGANPPGAGVVGYGVGALEGAIVAEEATHPKTFAPEFVDAFEVGTKNTLLDGRLTLNLDAFHYDYQGYQISYIVDRSAVNLNFDADIWGVEFESDWRPTENLRLGFKGGFETTRVAEGSKAIDVMDRTAGHSDWMVVRPFPAFPSNCVLPIYTADPKGGFGGDALATAPNVSQNGNPGPCEQAWVLGHDPVTSLDYVKDPQIGNGFMVPDYFRDYIGFDPHAHPEVNGGAGFYKDLSGKELPNAPKLTATLTADYALPLPNDWLLSLHGDLHYQGESWARIFNTPGYDKLKAYSNLNLAAIFTNDDAGWKVMAYVKNVLDSDSITGAFLNSDDTGLTTNVFLTEPRLYGIRITKDWSGGSALEGLLGHHTPGAPYPFKVEIGGGPSRLSADSQPYEPAFLDTYPATIPFPQDYQNNDLDWGDQREAKLTYTPAAGWNVSAALRYGRANGTDRSAVYNKLPPGMRTTPLGPPKYREGPLDYGVSTTTHGEKHTFVDFAVGKDFGMGLLGDDSPSTVSLGLRYAQFQSRSAVDLQGTPDWFFPALEPVKYPTDHHHEYQTAIQSERRFEGAGPLLSWDASRKLLGSEANGRVGLDWSVAGGALFGTQKTRVKGQRRSSYFSHSPEPFGPEVFSTVYNDPVDFQRTDRVTVPAVDLSLGLSYSIERVKVGAGYRWERYFGAIDGGVAEHKDYDRTIDGPYLKIAVGFGG